MRQFQLFILLLISLIFSSGFFFEKTFLTRQPASFIELSSLYFYRSSSEYFKSLDYSSNYHFIRLHYYKETPKFIIDLGYFGIPQTKGHYPYVENFYYKINEDKLVLGIKNLNWFQAERIWEDSLWASNLSADPLQTVINQGPVGVIGEYKKFQFFFQTSFIFKVRNSIKVKDKKLSVKTPWTLKPPGDATIGRDSSSSKIAYNLQIPPVQNILWSPGIGLLWKQNFYPNLQDKTRNFSIKLAYALKPSFDFFLKGKFFISLDPKDPVEFVIKPTVFYHHLSSLEISGRVGRWTAFQNITYEHPLLDHEGPEFVTQKRPPSLLFTSYLSYKISPTTSLFSSYRYIQQDFDKINTNVITDKEFFNSPFLFFNALSLGWGKKFSSGRLLGDMFLKVVYDFKQKGSVLNWKTNFQINSRLSTYFLVEVIGLIGDKVVQNKETKHFISDFRAHDRVQVGIRYVF